MELWYDDKYGKEEDIKLHKDKELEFNFGTFYVKIDGRLFKLTASDYATIQEVELDTDMNEDEFCNFKLKDK